MKKYLGIGLLFLIVGCDITPPPQTDYVKVPVGYELLVLAECGENVFTYTKDFTGNWNCRASYRGSPVEVANRIKPGYTVTETTYASNKKTRNKYYVIMKKPEKR